MNTTQYQPNAEFDIEVDGLQIVTNSDLPPYSGEYTVDALFTAPVKLETKGKRMIDDVTINQIDMITVANESGGNTVIIGREGL